MTDQQIIDKAKQGLVDLAPDYRAQLIELNVTDDGNPEISHNVTFQKQMTVGEEGDQEQWEFLKLNRGE